MCVCVCLFFFSYRICLVSTCSAWIGGSELVFPRKLTWFQHALLESGGQNCWLSPRTFTWFEHALRGSGAQNCLFFLRNLRGLKMHCLDRVFLGNARGFNMHGLDREVRTAGFPRKFTWFEHALLGSGGQNCWFFPRKFTWFQHALLGLGG